MQWTNLLLLNMKTQYIDNNKDLAACVQFLSQEPAFAIDLEFDKNRYRYGFNLCLVQIFANKHCFIIDPLVKGIDIPSLFPILENPAIQKVVYSFGEDLRLLHSLKCFPKNIFDISISMRLLDYPPISLGGAIGTILGIEISKTAQTSNWFTRPLQEEQLIYAAGDVFYLLDMQKILIEQAESKGITDWVNEENNFTDTLYFGDLDDNNYLKEKDKDGLTEHEFHIFKALMDFREITAKKYNKPSYQIIDKEYLRELSQRPTQIHRFYKINGIYPSIKNDNYLEQLSTVRQKAEKEAQELGLSLTESAIKRLSSEEYKLRKKQREEQEKIKQNIFKPIQKLIAENYGENAVTYIMGNRLMEDLAISNTENLRIYKKVLIEKYAAELGLDIQQYVNN